MRIRIPNQLDYSQIPIVELYKNINDTIVKTKSDELSIKLLKNNRRYLNKILKGLKFKTEKSYIEKDFIDITFPSGWSESKLNTNNQNEQRLPPTRYILDDKKRVRITIYDSKLDEKDPNLRNVITSKISFNTRYSLIMDNCVDIIYINDMATPIKSFTLNDLKAYRYKLSKKDALRSLAKAYLNSNYPYWEDFTKYWD